MKQSLPSFKPLLIFSTLTLALTFLSRFGLMIWKIERIESTDQFLQLLINGLRIDLAFLGQVLLIPLLLIFIGVWGPKLQKITSRLVLIWLVSILLLVIFLELSTPLFITQFDIRPNRLFIEYLNSPVEVSKMLFNGFFWQSTVIIAFTAALFFFLSKRLAATPQDLTNHSVFKKITLAAFIVGLLCVDIFMGRSGLQHRPINPAMVAVSGDRLVNSFALNSPYSVLFSFYQMNRQSVLKYPYGQLSEQQMIEIVRSSMDDDLEFTNPEVPTLHQPNTQKRQSKKDLIIVVEESLGAHFVKSLGGNPVTPRIEEWRHKSWFFDHLYSSGIRSARGLEAIISGFLPTTSQAVLKLSKAQGDFFTLASYLKQEGYQSTFIYGGESHFDNMKGFFLNNGFDAVIDQNDYENPEFMGSWGVSDEDLFKRALKYIKRAHDTPQFTLVFTSSNHPPYEFPDGKIKLHDQQKATALNSGKYADFALGEFLDQLEEAHTLDHSTVLVVADHEDRVHGTKPVPTEEFRIPGFILDPDIEPHIDNRLAGQIDLAPTLISLLGINRPLPAIGHDLTHDLHGKERAIMQFGNNQAYMTDSCTIYLQPGQKPLAECNEANDVDIDGLVSKAIAHAQFAEFAYNQEMYHL